MVLNVAVLLVIMVTGVRQIEMSVLPNLVRMQYVAM